MALTRPTNKSERIAQIDSLRGLALLGILLANLYSFMGYNSYSPQQIVELPTVDRAVLFGIDWFVEGKFYGIFSMLFGVGFALQQERFAQRGDAPSFARYWRRRMSVLLCIGLLHMYLVWNGDILTLYAILGFFLPSFAKRSQNTLLRWIFALLLIPLLIHVGIYLAPRASFWGIAGRFSQGLQEQLGYGERSLLQMRVSSQWDQVFWINVLKAIPRPMSYLMTGRYFQVLGMFLCGVVAARRWLSGLGQGPWKPPKSARWIGALGLVTSLAYALIKGAIGSPFAVDEVGLIQALVYHVGAICLALGLSAVLLGRWSAVPNSWLARQLALPGRMALSNYLIQNICAVLIFFGYGLAQMRALPFAYLPLFALGIFSLQLLSSRWWLSRFEQGPVELLWKRLAYG